MSLSSRKRACDGDAPAPEKKSARPDLSEKWQAALYQHADAPLRVRNFLQWATDGFTTSDIAEAGGDIDDLDFKAQLVWDAILCYRARHENTWVDFWPRAGNSTAVRAELFRICHSYYNSQACCSLENCNVCRDAGYRCTKVVSVVAHCGYQFFNQVRSARTLAMYIDSMVFVCNPAGLSKSDRMRLLRDNVFLDHRIRLFYAQLDVWNVLVPGYSMANISPLITRLLRCALGGLRLTIDGNEVVFPSITANDWLGHELDHRDPAEKFALVHATFGGCCVDGMLELAKVDALTTAHHQEKSHTHDLRGMGDTLQRILGNQQDFRGACSVAERITFFEALDRPEPARVWPNDDDNSSKFMRGIYFFLERHSLLPLPGQVRRDVVRIHVGAIFKLILGGQCAGLRWTDTGVEQCDAALCELEFNHLFEKGCADAPPFMAKYWHVSSLLTGGRYLEAFRELCKCELLCRPHHTVWTARNFYGSDNFNIMFSRAREMMAVYFPDRLAHMPAAWTPEHVRYLDVCHRNTRLLQYIHVLEMTPIIKHIAPVSDHQNK